MPPSRIQPTDALIVVDVQKDFCQGGALAVPSGDEVIPILNDWIEAARASGARIVLSRDWHPPEHMSFHHQGGPWPPHCVRDTEGAEFHPRLTVPQGALIISKGSDRSVENYSAFDGTNLESVLKSQGVRRLWVGGLAQDYCVRETVLDACRSGFEVHVISEATRPVDRELGRKALNDMCSAGAILEESTG